MNHAANDLVDETPILQRRVARANFLVGPREQTLRSELLQGQQAGAVAIVDVVVVVGNGVSNIGDLRLETRLFPIEKSFTQIAQAPRIARRAVFQDALAGLEHQVEAGKVRVPRFQFINDTQRLEVVLESAVVAHAGI